MIRTRFRIRRAAVECALIALLLHVPGGATGAPVPARETVRISAALVDHQMQVHRVPLHPFAIIGAHADTLIVRTDTDGNARVELRDGVYSIRSIAPVQFDRRVFRWSVDIKIDRGAGVDVMLTNDNAMVESVPEEARPETSRDAASVLFERYRKSVLRIRAGLAHGTGFLADTLDGIILTNAHVVERCEPSNLTVELDSATIVRGQLVARDADADIAVLRVHPGRIRGLARIRLQGSSDSPPQPGERLFAMGFPLHQDLTITAGIASGVRSGAVISDVNINPGNSGGPLLDAAGNAIAVNTFGDVGDRGSGVAGSILVARAGNALALAAKELQNSAPP